MGLALGGRTQAAGSRPGGREVETDRGVQGLAGMRPQMPLQRPKEGAPCQEHELFIVATSQVRLDLLGQ